jgi:hypothetical protein
MPKAHPKTSQGMIAFKETPPGLMIVPARDMGAFAEMPTLSPGSSVTVKCPSAKLAAHVTQTA